VGGPTVETHITLHTLWQALAGVLPPMALAPTAVPRATLDSREVQPGDLFIAQPGQQTDGHRFIGKALAQGAGAILCEERGREDAAQAGATIVDCRGGAGSRAPHDPALGPLNAPLAFIVDDATLGLQALGAFQRLHRTQADLYVIGVTGSVGKTSTKELVAAVMRERYETLYSAGNLNSEQGLPLTLLALSMKHECAVLEMGMYAMGEIDTLCRLGRPVMGIVTNVGPVHLERLGTIENIQKAKSELVRNLPSADDGGVAILNWDDPRVRAMAEVTQARVFRYGLTPEADLWADEIASAGMEGIRFRFNHRHEDGKVETLHVRVPLLGRHSAHTALRAAAAGIMRGMQWPEIVTGLQNISAHLRLVMAKGISGSTIIDDTYNASPESTIAALNLLDDLPLAEGGRRIAVLGDMLELGSYEREGHTLVGARAANVVDVLVTVGPLGRSIGEAALEAGLSEDQVTIMGNDRDAVALLHRLLHTNDLVLVKGSRAVGMDAIVADIAEGREQPPPNAAPPSPPTV
jgi:UDP-N-acetylmuramoyl-tripeptide--D-alanyl-D-alanine ligase